jgi:hypothetical protein
MGNGGTLTFHAATRLALDLPSGNAGPSIRSCTTSRVLPNSIEPVEVATAVWRMAYGNDDAIERGFADPARKAAVAFLVELVQEVEGRLLEGWTDHPGILVQQIADAAVPSHPMDRAQLCEQFGMVVPANRIAGERLFALAHELCASITANVLPILRVSQPLTRAETFGRARELKTLALVPTGRAGESQEAHESARMAVEWEVARLAAEREGARVAAEQEAARMAAEREATRIAAEEREAARTEAARIAAAQEAARVATEREVARVAAEAARVAEELERARVAVDELEAMETARLAAEAAPVRDEPEAPAATSTEVLTSRVAPDPTKSTRAARRDAESKAIAFLSAGAIVLFGLRRRAKRRAS